MPFSVYPVYPASRSAPIHPKRSRCGIIKSVKRYLAIDPGDKRTGLAVGDDLLKIASPVDCLHASTLQSLLQAVARAIDDHCPDELVIGIPLNMDGAPGPAAEKARALARLLRQHTGIPVHEVDERLTSFAADQLMQQSGLTHKQKKARRDALAAAAILNDFLQRPGVPEMD